MKYEGAGSERLVYIAWVLALAACVLVLPRCAPATPAARLTRGPYLQRLTPDSVTIVWNTNVAAECAVQIRPLGSQPTVVGGLTDSVCVVAVDGLTPGTVYAYTPLADGVPLAAAAGFRTPHVALPYTFLVFGDSGSGNQDQLAVRDSMLNSPADFIVHTGDMSYPEAAPGQWNPKYFTPYRDLLSELVLWPSLGNHDVRADDGASWRDVFLTPANNAAGSEDYYSFDYGNSHFVVLDSNRSLKPGSAQHTFLNQDLAASTATWNFVVFHHTIYSSGQHGSDLSIRQYLVPVFDAHGVDVVFMGHDHDYERTKPLLGDQVVAPGEGRLYVTTGGGGGEIRPMASSAFTAYSESVLHFVRVSVAGESLLLEMVRADGSIGDSLVLAKGAAGECGDGRLNQVGEVCDGTDDVACPGQCDAGCQCPPVCGDGRQDPATEECDWPADSACPGLCIADCTCADPPPVLDLAPIGDTYIEAGSEATWDHGASTRVDIDAQPRGIAYLKFDLSGVAFPIESAMLTLHCTNSSDDGGTVYPVSDSSWTEGTGNGVDGSSAQGPGLKWIDVDTDGDGDVDGADVSPYVPLLTEPLAGLGAVTSGDFYQIDLTSALGSGPVVYSFAIVNDSSNGTSYSSRDNPAVTERPVLRVRLPLECHADVDCADGVFCNGGEICVRGRCEPGPPVECDDGEACTVDECDESAASCRFEPVAEGTSCEDGDLCTQGETCQAGICIGVNPVICTGLDPCHDAGVCDPETGMCSNPPKTDGTACDDANLCTQTDTCHAGVCVGTNPIVCAALDQCHDAGTCDPATGVCSNPEKPEDTLCNDGDLCTQIDTCEGGVCGGADPVTCAALDQCHDAGVCNQATGLCSNPPKADGTACNDGSLCTRADSCIEGSCVGMDPVTCTALDQCHDAGVCDPATGFCSNPERTDGTSCDDGNLCTQSDTCQAGACAGGNTVTCTALDQCHDAGVCDPTTGLCSKQAKADGSPCDDGNACSQSDTCMAGSCAGTNWVACTEADECHQAGSCDPATGLCSGTQLADGTSCDDGNACTDGDLCFEGECTGEPLPDSDADGFCDAIDLCPQIPDPAQLDTDRDGVGDLCQCTAPAPGRCIAGGGSQRTDCLLELTTVGPVTLNRRGTKIKPVLRCSDGDPACDLDGACDGQCTFGLALCFGNTDPRYPSCEPAQIRNVEVVGLKGKLSADRRRNVEKLEQAMAGLGLEVGRRRGVIASAVARVESNLCSPLVRLMTPAPRSRARKAVRQKFRLRAQPVGSRRDEDTFILVCER